MRQVLAAVIYTALAVLANPALASDWAAAEAARVGDMKKLVFHEAPKAVPEVALIGADGAEVSLSEHHGSWVVLNFWATWCAPCRKEMPTLANLQTAMDDADLPVDVVTVATGRNSVAGIAKFFAEIEVDNLPEWRDPKQQLARSMGVLGLPITVILDPSGNEVARLRGDAYWDSESAVEILTLLASGAS